MDDAAERRFKVRRIDHVELCVPGRREAARWYTRVLGLEIVPECEHWAEEPQGPLMISSDGGRTKLALFRGTPQGGRESVGFQRVAFLIDGPEFLRFLAALERLALLDHRERCVTARDVVDHETTYSIYFCDPYGNRLEVTTYDHDTVRRGLAG